MLLSAFEIPPESAVKAAMAPMVMTARTTPYSAMVCPSSSASTRRCRRDASLLNNSFTPLRRGTACLAVRRAALQILE